MGSKLVSAVEWWENQGIWSCSLLCRDEGFNRILLEPGSHLSFKILKGRFCIGSYRLLAETGEKGVPDSWKKLNPCPDEAKIKKGIRCRRCAMLDVARACLLCNGETCFADPVTRRVCEESTAYVYLALFGAKRIKAGVSHESRIPKRWIEQGADMAKRVLVGNGREVRGFEKVIQDELGALRQVKAERKINVLGNNSDLAISIQLLNTLEDKVHEKFPKNHHFHEEPWVLSSYYRIPQLDRRPLELKVRGGQEVSGQVLGVKGPILLFKRRELPFVLNLNRLIGRKIDTEEVFIKKAQADLEKFLFKP